jgi:hypothetical protein
MSQLENIISEAVDKSIEAKGLIAEEQLARLAGFTETDMKYLSEFWPLVEHEDEMFVLSHEMIRTRLTNSKDRQAVRDFYKNKLEINEFQENIDYVLLTDQEIRIFLMRVNSPSLDYNVKLPPRLPKLYKITVSCYERLLMKSGTSDGANMRNYLVKVQKLSKLKTKVMVAFRERMLRLQSNQLLLESKQAIEEKEARITELTKDIEEAKTKFNTLVETIRLKEKKNYAYVATCPTNVKLRKFKAGKADNLNSRLSTYNTGRPETDKYYYIWISQCYETQCVETVLKHILDSHREGKPIKNSRSCSELYTIDPEVLIKIMECIVSSQNNCMDIYNRWISDLKNGTHVNPPARRALDLTRFLDPVQEEKKANESKDEEKKATPQTIVNNYITYNGISANCSKCDQTILRRNESKHINSRKHRK